MERYGTGAIIAFVIVYLAVEFGLDLVRDLLIDYIKDRREDKGLSEWGNEPDGEE